MALGFGIPKVKKVGNIDSVLSEKPLREFLDYLKTNVTNGKEVSSINSLLSKLENGVNKTVQEFICEVNNPYTQVFKTLISDLKKNFPTLLKNAIYGIVPIQIPDEFSSISQDGPPKIRNLLIAGLDSGQEIYFEGKKQKIIALQIQAYQSGEDAYVDMHKEKKDVTEIYFPLVGNVNVSLELSSGKDSRVPDNAPSQMKGSFEKEDLDSNISITSNGKDLICILGDSIIDPVVLPANKKHGTSYDSNCELAMFIAIKLEPSKS